MKYIKNFFGHLHTINKHRFLVCKFCFKMGLYKQGLLHDLSKYSFVEFFAGVKYFQGNRSPIDAEKKDKGYSAGWLHHKGHNKHHWQYWIELGPNGTYIVIDPPKNVVKEMIADRIAACIVYQKEKYHPSSALEFFEQSKEIVYMPTQTKELTRKYLTIVAENDLNTALKMIKKD